MKHKQQHDDEEFATPQIFVNEMLKIYNDGRISLETLDEQILTIIITVNKCVISTYCGDDGSW